MKRTLLISLGALLVLGVGLAFASDASPSEEPENSPFFEATLQQAVNELDGQASAPQTVAAPMPTQNYTYDQFVWPECGPPGYTWNLVTWPECHFTNDPQNPDCDTPWPTEDYTWDSTIWADCGPDITQDSQQVWCNPDFTSNADQWPQCSPGYTQDTDDWPQCNPRYTSNPAWWPQCDISSYTTSPDAWPECRVGYTGDPYLWQECHYTSDPSRPACNSDTPYPTQDYTSNSHLWPECEPKYTTDPTALPCDDPEYTQDPAQWAWCQLSYTADPRAALCHFTSDPTAPACEEPWPTMDYTWDASLWKDCSTPITQDPDAWWCFPDWTSSPNLTLCDPYYTSNPDALECLPAYTYDEQEFADCAEYGTYTSSPRRWPECGYYTADARIWPECHYTFDPAVWPVCAEDPPFPTKDYTSDPRLWPECKFDIPSDYTTDASAWPECHYTSDPASWPECEPTPEGDLGDAPDSTNHAGSLMTAYPAGGPAGTLAYFPTVFDPATGLPQGPKHWLPRGDSWLGPWVSVEKDADLPPDEDGLTNIDPSSDTPDRDKHDDGVLVPVPAPRCAPTVFTYTVTITPGAPLTTRYVNVWFDWNWDGDWQDAFACNKAFDAPEWAVQNQVIPALPPGTYVLATPTYLPWVPAGAGLSDTWMRISIAEQPAPAPPSAAPDGRGPRNGYKYGETEDYYFKPDCPQPIADFKWDPSTICPGDKVYFWDTSTGFPTSWSWDFDDGGTSNAQNPTHAFASTGTYDVSLTVTNACGSDKVTKKVQVVDCPSQEEDYDIYIKDSAADDGSVPSSSPWWLSPDIWVRRDGDCTKFTHQKPIPGTTNTICVRVRNRMTATVTDITVQVYYANAALGLAWPGSFNYISSFHLASLAGGAEKVKSVVWNTPYTTGHFCLLARADAPDDPINTGPDTVLPTDEVMNNNNIAQRNTYVVDYPTVEECGFHSSVFETDVVFFDAVNTEASSKKVDIEFDSDDFPLDTGALIVEPGALWNDWASLTHFDQVDTMLIPTAFPASMNDVQMAPHETARMTVTITAEIDERFTIRVKEKIGDDDAGGIEFVRDLPRCVYLPTILKQLLP
jgi:PKD repeat protein